MRVLAATAVVVLACGGSSIPPDRCDAQQISLSCSNMTAIGECTDFTGLSTKDHDYWIRSCGVSGGTLVATCPTTDLVGTCITPAKDSVTCSPSAQVAMRLYLPQHTVDEAKIICEDIPLATWVPN